ncbi:MAG: hypothetical protein AAF171_27185 [Cyanobacteria bacterium P01_A01_bin.116]
MQIAALSEQTLNKIKSLRWDRIIEKHEGPETWAARFKWGDPEFLMVEGRAVLLPVERSHHQNITVLRAIWSADGQSLTLFLKDTTYSDEWYDSGFLAVCDKLTGEAFYVATAYHEWFIIEQSV